MNYYHTQLNAREAQNFFIKEFNKALAFFHKAEIIPAKLSIWRLSGGVKMGHLLRMNDEFYLVALYTDIVKQYQGNRQDTSVDVRSMQLRIYHLEKLDVTDILTMEILISPSEQKELVYEGQQVYACLKPEFVRGMLRGSYSADLADNNRWYFNDFETPNNIIQKIVYRYRVGDLDHCQPIFTLKLKATPYKGFRKNIIYKRYGNGVWTFTNRNGREVTRYDLVK